MPIIKTTSTKCNCDICGGDCTENDPNVSIDIGVGVRDVGPTRIFARFLAIVPYAPQGHDIVCRECLKKALKRWLETA